MNKSRQRFFPMSDSLPFRSETAKEKQVEELKVSRREWNSLQKSET